MHVVLSSGRSAGGAACAEAAIRVKLLTWHRSNWVIHGRGSHMVDVGPLAVALAVC